jgi:hypothetical protein
MKQVHQLAHSHIALLGRHSPDLVSRELLQVESTNGLVLLIGMTMMMMT